MELEIQPIESQKRALMEFKRHKNNETGTTEATTGSRKIQ